MAATETTSDAVIVIPPSNTGKVEIVTTDTGTEVKATEATSKVVFEVNDGGTLSSTGAPLKSAFFSFTGSGSVEITNDVVKDSRVLGGGGSDSVGLGNSDPEVVTVVKGLVVNAGDGEDTVTVAANLAKNVKVKLGENDGAADVIEIDTKLRKIENMVIKNFGKEDSFVIDGKTFTSKDLRDQPFAPNITFEFDK